MTLMIKKTLLTAATVSLLALSPGIQAASDSATVNITATVVDNTCTPQWSTNGVDVAMGRVSLKDFGSDKFKAKFFSNNYHIFRAALYAKKAGLRANGVGSYTRFYFLPNAIIREFAGIFVMCCPLLCIGV